MHNAAEALLPLIGVVDSGCERDIGRHAVKRECRVAILQIRMKCCPHQAEEVIQSRSDTSIKSDLSVPQRRVEALVELQDGMNICTLHMPLISKAEASERYPRCQAKRLLTSTGQLNRILCGGWTIGGVAACFKLVISTLF